MLDENSPLSLLVSGSMEDLLLAREYVEAAVGLPCGLHVRRLMRSFKVSMQAAGLETGAGGRLVAGQAA